MLSAFIKYIERTNPDIIISWFGNGFDFPYLLNRMKNLGININRLGRGGFCYTGMRCKIYGRVLFDMLEAYKKHFSEVSKESWSLDYISKYELGDKGGKTPYEGTLDELEKNDYNKFLEYNLKDVELMVLLDDQLKIINFFDEVRQTAFCRFEDVFMNSKTADCLCLRYAKEHNFVLPSVITHERGEYEGGYVVTPIPKLYENIALLDFKSLYPGIMIGFNISYETLDPNGEINFGNDYKFRKTPGIIPSIVKVFLDKRKLVKERQKGLNRESDLYKSLGMTEYAYKIIANSFYGVLGFRTFRLYNLQAASAITYIARNILKEIIKWFEQNGYNVIYGDTDSVFIQMKDDNINKIIELNKKANEYVKNYVEQYIEEKNNIFELEFGEVYKSLFFKRKADGTGAKKKYAGRLLWKKGEYIDKVNIVGFETRRSDSPEIGREFMKKILSMVIDQVDPNEVMKYADDFKEKIKTGYFTPEELGLPVGINKALEKYQNQIHVRAARLGNERHNENIRAGDKIKWLYIKGEHNVIGFKDKMPKGYEIDYDNMVRRLVTLKVEPIFNSLNWGYNKKTIDLKQTTL